MILAAFNDVATAGQAVSNIIADGILPAGLELMDNAAIRAADDFVNAGYPRDAAAMIVIRERRGVRHGRLGRKGWHSAGRGQWLRRYLSS